MTTGRAAPRSRRLADSLSLAPAPPPHRGRTPCGGAPPRPEQEPIRPGPPERHAHAPAVDDANAAEPAVELHVGVTADDERGRHSFERLQQTLLGRQAGEALALASRRPVAEQDPPHPADLELLRPRPSLEPREVPAGQLTRGPAQHLPLRLRERLAGCGAPVRHGVGIVRLGLRQHRQLSVPADEVRRRVEREKQLEGLARHRTGNHIAPDQHAGRPPCFGLPRAPPREPAGWRVCRRELLPASRDALVHPALLPPTSGVVRPAGRASTRVARPLRPIDRSHPRRTCGTSRLQSRPR